MDGGCPGRAHGCLQKSRAGKLGWSTGRAADLSVAHQSAGGIMRKMGGGEQIWCSFCQFGLFSFSQRAGVTVLDTGTQGNCMQEP